MTGRTTSARPFLQALWRKHRYSRVPVYKDRVDNIVGVVYSMRILEYDMNPEVSPAAYWSPLHRHEF